MSTNHMNGEFKCACESPFNSAISTSASVGVFVATESRVGVLLAFSLFARPAVFPFPFFGTVLRGMFTRSDSYGIGLQGDSVRRGKDCHSIDRESYPCAYYLCGAQVVTNKRVRMCETANVQIENSRSIG